MTTRPNSMEMNNVGVIGLVAGREISTRLRSKAYRIVTLVLMVLIIGICVAFKLLSGSGFGDVTVGYTSANQTIVQSLPGLAETIGQKVNLVEVSEADGQQQVSSGKLDALINGDGTAVNVVVKKNINGNLGHALDLLAQRVTLYDEIKGLHGNPQVMEATAAGAKAVVSPQEPATPYQAQQLILGIVAGVLIYVSLLINGQFVAQGVVEEKSSRVVELLLSTVRPWQLMAGKVLGIGTVGLIQMLAIGVTGVVAGTATHVLTGSISATVGTVLWLVVWYLLGFFMYAVVFAALGALVSRQEEVSGVTFPALVPLILGYVLGVSVLPSDPSNSLMEVLSMIPLFAPTVMPIRLALGGVPIWEALLAIVLVAGLIPVLIWLAARIYRNAVLRTGARVKFSQALRPA